ncbi:MAG: phosphoribosylanthranilate isomerase [Alphaproteobacteria bacterium]|nr:phosphoribosylanthranilate isomerase [Alphaproteobacteria bacterium]
MPVTAKICGINDPASMRAAVKGGASHVGLVFYPPSPRSLTGPQAQRLATLVPHTVKRVGLLVDPNDMQIDAVLSAIPLDMLQLHGSESPGRVQSIRERFGIPLMKALKIATAADVEIASAYVGIADALLFDAKAPTGGMPGGNAVAFDWSLLDGRSFPMPWMIAGGIDIANVGLAVARSGAKIVDVSSGVEDAPSKKNPDKITAFLAAVAALP